MSISKKTEDARKDEKRKWYESASQKRERTFGDKSFFF